MDCAGDWFCGGVCGGVWIGGVVYELGEAEGIYAICDLQDYFGGGGFVFCFADGMRRRGRELNAETQRAQRRETLEHRPFEAQDKQECLCHMGILSLETKRKMGLCGGRVLL